MQAKREGKHAGGRPQRAAHEIPTRNGLRRFPVEVPTAMLLEIDLLSDREGRSRVAQVRMLLGEALEARKKVERGA